MKRIQVVGYSGCGKTTLARQLSKKLDIPHYELDGIFFLEDWQQKPDETFAKDVQKVLKRDKWILCGVYIDRLNGETVNATDTIVVLRYSPFVFMPRMIKRSFKRILLVSFCGVRIKKASLTFYLCRQNHYYTLIFARIYAMAEITI